MQKPTVTEFHADDNLPGSISTSISADSLASPTSSSSSAMLTSSSSSTLTPTSASIVTDAGDAATSHCRTTPTPVCETSTCNLGPETTIAETEAVNCAPYVAHLAAFRFWQQRDSESSDRAKCNAKSTFNLHDGGPEQPTESHRQRHLTPNNTRCYLNYAVPPSRTVNETEVFAAKAVEENLRSSPALPTSISLARACVRNSGDTQTNSKTTFNAADCRHDHKEVETTQPDLSEHFRMRKTIMDNLRNLEQRSANSMPVTSHASSASSAISSHEETASTRSSERETQQRLANATRYVELKQQLAHIDNELSHLMHLSSLPLVSSSTHSWQTASTVNGTSPAGSRSSNRHASAEPERIAQWIHAAHTVEHASRSGVGTSSEEINHTHLRRPSHSSVPNQSTDAAPAPISANQTFYQQTENLRDYAPFSYRSQHPRQSVTTSADNNHFPVPHQNRHDQCLQQSSTALQNGSTNCHNNNHLSNTDAESFSASNNTHQPLPAGRTAENSVVVDPFSSMNDICTEFERNRHTLLALSRDQESCMQMRQAGTWVPQMVQIMYTNNCDLTSAPPLVRQHAREILYNLVYSMPNDKRSKRERRIFELLDEIRTYSEKHIYRMVYEQKRIHKNESGDGLSSLLPDDAQNVLHHQLTPNPTAALAALLKRSFEEYCRHTICLLGGLQAVCEVSQVDEYVIRQTAPLSPVNVNDADATATCNKRRKWCAMILTNLTCGDGVNKALVCSSRGTMQALVSLISSADATLCQSATSVMSNLTWRPDMRSKEALLDCGVAVAVMRAVMQAADMQSIASAGEAGQGANLKNLLSILWNLSSHGDEEKTLLCSMPGVLNFVVDMISACSATLMPSMASSSTQQSCSPSITSVRELKSSTSRSTTPMSVSASSVQGNATVDTLAILENTTGLLRNLAACIASSENYRRILRERGAFCILLKQLCSSSLTVVTNVCGILANLSQNCAQDQALLLHFGALKMLRPLTAHKNKMINAAACATVKNLMQAQAVLRDKRGVRTPYSNKSSPAPFAQNDSANISEDVASPLNTSVQQNHNTISSTPPYDVVHIMQKTEVAATNRYYQNAHLLVEDVTNVVGSNVRHRQNGFSRGVEMTDAAVRDRMNMDMYVLENAMVADKNDVGSAQLETAFEQPKLSEIKNEVSSSSQQYLQHSLIQNGSVQDLNPKSDLNDEVSNAAAVSSAGKVEPFRLPESPIYNARQSNLHSNYTDEFDDFTEMEIMPNISMMLPLHRSPRSRKGLIMTLPLAGEAKAANRPTGNTAEASLLKGADKVPADSVPNESSVPISTASVPKFDEKLTERGRSSGSGGCDDNDDQVRSYATQATPILSSAGSLDDLNELITLGASCGRDEKSCENLCTNGTGKSLDRQPVLSPRNRSSPLSRTMRQSMRVVASRGCRNHHQTPMVFSRSSSIDSLLIASERVTSSRQVLSGARNASSRFVGAYRSTNNEELESVYTPLLTGRVSPNDLPDTPATVSPPPIQQRRALNGIGHPTAISSSSNNTSKLQSKPLYEIAQSNNFSKSGAVQQRPNPSTSEIRCSSDQSKVADAALASCQPTAAVVYDGQKQRSVADETTPLLSTKEKSMMSSSAITRNGQPAPILTAMNVSHVPLEEKQAGPPAAGTKLSKRSKSRSRSSQRRTSCVGNNIIVRREEDAVDADDDDDDAWLAECIYGALPKQPRAKPVFDVESHSIPEKLVNRPSSAQNDGAQMEAAESRKNELARQLRRSGKERRSLRTAPSASAAARARVSRPDQPLQHIKESASNAGTRASATTDFKLTRRMQNESSQPPPLPRRRSPSNMRLKPPSSGTHVLPKQTMQPLLPQPPALSPNKPVSATEARTSTKPEPPTAKHNVKKLPLDEPPPLPPRPARLPVPTSLSVTAAEDKISSPSRVILSTFASPTTTQTAIALGSNDAAPSGELNLLDMARSVYSTTSGADDNDSEFDESADAVTHSVRTHRTPAPIRSQKARHLNGTQAGVEAPPVPPKASVGASGGARIVKPIAGEVTNEQPAPKNSVASSPKVIRGGGGSIKKPDCLKPPKIPVILTKALEAKMQTHSPTFCASRTSSVTTPRSFSRQQQGSSSRSGVCAGASRHSATPSSNSKIFDQQLFARSSKRSSVRARKQQDRSPGKPVTGLEALSAFENDRSTIVLPSPHAIATDSTIMPAQDHDAVDGGSAAHDEHVINTLSTSDIVTEDNRSESEPIVFSDAVPAAAGETVSCSASSGIDTQVSQESWQPVITSTTTANAAVLNVHKPPSSSLASKLVSAFTWSRSPRITAETGSGVKQQRSTSSLPSPASAISPLAVSPFVSETPQQQRGFRAQRKSTVSVALKTRTNKIKSSRSVENTGSHSSDSTTIKTEAFSANGASGDPLNDENADGVAYLTWTKKTKKPIDDSAQQEMGQESVKKCA